MDVIFYYALFAVTTSLAGIYELFNPVLRTLEEKDPKNNVVQYKFITYVTFFFLGLITAPFLLPSVLIPSISTRFKLALLNSLQ